MGDVKHAYVTVQLEEAINNLDRVITDYLVELSRESLSKSESKLQHSLFQNIRDIERVGDHFENLVELIQAKDTNRVKFSDEANDELKEMYELVLDTVNVAILALDKQDKKLASEVLKKEEQIDEMERTLRKRHFHRLNDGECTGEAGVIFADIASNLERIGDHAVNIAESVLEE